MVTDLLAREPSDWLVRQFARRLAVGPRHVRELLYETL
jgi:hypothetical protein